MLLYHKIMIEKNSLNIYETITITTFTENRVVVFNN